MTTGEPPGRQCELESGNRTETRPAAHPRRWWRRLVPFFVVGLVGALLGAGGIAWQAGTLPSARADACWGSLSEDDLTRLFRGWETRVEEVPPERGRGWTSAPSGRCDLRSYRDGAPLQEATIRLHELDGPRGKDARVWPDEFLSAWMSSLGDGLTGMASADRAWVALPTSCTGRSDARNLTPPTVVDVAFGAERNTPYEQVSARRDVLAHVVVQAANSAMAKLGCQDRLPEPRALPAFPEPRALQADELCGIDGLELPPGTGDPLEFTRSSAGHPSPARICAAASSDESIYQPRGASLRLTTVEDPSLGNIFASSEMGRLGPRMGHDGYWSPARAVGVLDCPSGRVWTVAEQLDSMPDPSFTLTRTLLPRYMEAEAKRLNCAPFSVDMPT